MRSAQPGFTSRLHCFRGYVREVRLSTENGASTHSVRTLCALHLALRASSLEPVDGRDNLIRASDNGVGSGFLLIRRQAKKD